MKTEIKENLKSLSVKELMAKLKELQTEKMKLETTCYLAGGSVRSYPKEKATGKFGNIKRIKKNIARVKTWLNVKMKAERMGKK